MEGLAPRGNPSGRLIRHADGDEHFASLCVERKKINLPHLSQPLETGTTRIPVLEYLSSGF